jgi:molybdopterin-dependent oxidoreductase alpha subunit
VLAGKVNAFVSLGGNFVRAIPEREAMEAAWTGLKLTVNIATKLNRSHLLPGEESFLLPCLGRSEEDRQASGPQVVTIEDSLSCIHGSTGHRAPASEHLLSELAIVAGIAKATLPPNPKVDWDRWVGDYGIVRERIEETYPEFFKKFNERLFVPGGFYRGNTARERIWKTESGKAEFTVPKSLSAAGFEDAPGRWRLMTLRSNDQFNTTIYGYSDRLRGVEGTRDVLLINPRDIARAGLREGQVVTLVSDADDGKERLRPGVTVTPFDLPDGCIATYYPEANPLLPLSHHDGPSKTPAAKAIPVRIRA